MLFPNADNNNMQAPGVLADKAGKAEGSLVGVLEHTAEQLEKAAERAVTLAKSGGWVLKVARAVGFREFVHWNVCVTRPSSS